MHVDTDLIYLSSEQSSRNAAIAARDNILWQSLSKISLQAAVGFFLETLNGNTKRSYKTAFNSIFALFLQLNLFDPKSNLQTFSLSNLEFLLDEIKSKIVGSEATKQARAAAFVAFTRYLQRSTSGLIRKVVPMKDKGNQTFRQIRDTAATKALNRTQWMQFLYALKRTSFRDYLVAKTMLQGAKRTTEVLSAKLEQINWSQNQIIFKQLKSHELEKHTIITYPASFMNELREYVGDRKSGYIFVTRNGKALTQPHLYRVFSAAGAGVGIPFTVHPHVLRASAITYLSSHGFASDQILRVSGHADTKLVRYYDKTPMEENPSQDISLI